MKAKIKAARRLLARNVRSLREGLKLTMEGASERAGMNWRHWQKVEAGEVNPTLATLVKLAHALNVDVVALFAPGGRA